MAQAAVPDQSPTANRPCWLEMIRGVGSIILYVVLFAVMLLLLFPAVCLIWLVHFAIGVGYLVAYIFHIASCGYLFRFEEFIMCSCCLGRCGRTVDKGGPDGQGFPEGRTWYGTIDNQRLWVGRGGDGGGGGGGGGGGDGGGGCGGGGC